MGRSHNSEAKRAWLAAHPDRSEGWLTQIIAEGFDIHHLDHDHSNNHPRNLLLIEIQDHRMILHGQKTTMMVKSALDRRRTQRLSTISKGEKAYQLRQLGLTWSEVDAFLRGRLSNNNARAFALHHKLPWPIPGIEPRPYAKNGTISQQVIDNIDAISELLGRKAEPEEVPRWRVALVTTEQSGAGQ